MREKANADIRAALKIAGIPFWELGKKWGCNECTVTRRLRTELSKAEKELVFRLIAQLKQETGNEED